MEFTHENRRTRWLILAAAALIAAVLLIVHTRVSEESIAQVDRLGRRGATALNTPLQRTIPMLYADTQTWTRQALALLETDAWRIRFTDIDNAPYGREVHWNSAFAWLIAGNGWLRHTFTGEPLPLALERSLAWFNVPLFLTLIVFFAAWTARRAGAAAGVFVALAMLGSTEFSNGFSPAFVDHHGVLTVANFGLALGVLFMGAGWIGRPGDPDTSLLPASRERAREGALFSALSGAIGMWVSAASVVPGIAMVGVAGLGATLWQGRRLQAAATFEPGLWRLWGRVGAGASFLFYLLEYAPNHLGMRLEVNHPLYALAWWGGSELIAQFAELHLRLRAGRGAIARLAGPLAAVLAVPALVLIAGPKVFIIRDPLILQLSSRVAEGLPLPRAIQLIGWIVFWMRVPWAAMTLLPAAFLLTRRSAGDRLVLGFATLATVAFLAMGGFQIRFFANAGGPEICLFLAVFAAAAKTWSQRQRWALVLGVIAVVCLPERIYRIAELRQAVRVQSVVRQDMLQPLYRDIAAALRQSQPAGDIILLTDPDASTGIGYFGRLKTIGTLYWENLDGMKAAAAMYAATSMPAARGLLRARRVTHVAVISESSFVPDFFELAHPGAKPGEYERSFAYQVFAGRNVPMWLEQIPYQPPPDITIPQLRVMLFQTRFGTPGGEEAFRLASEKVRGADYAAAERAIDHALALDPSMAEFWKLKSELLISRGNLDDGFGAIEKTLALAPPSHQSELARSAAGVFYEKGAHARAVTLYRASLARRYDATTASNLGWILATSREASVRDGAAALELARRVAAGNPASYYFLSTLAAALAETGQFTEAASAATRALEAARKSGDPKIVPRAEERLRAYEAGRPWRQ